MSTKIETFNQTQLKKDLPDIRPGDTVRVYQKIPTQSIAGGKGKEKDKDKNKERIQIFEGQVLARKHGKEIGATITVRKITSGIGVERIFPIHSPSIGKIEIINRGKVRRAKLYYLRTAKGKKAKLKKRKVKKAITEKKPLEKTKEGKEKLKEKNK